MITRFQFYRLALDANERQTNVPDVDVLPIPTLDERVNIYLRAVHGSREFTEEERMNARNALLDTMAADIATKMRKLLQLRALRTTFVVLDQFLWRGLTEQVSFRSST